MNTDLCARWQRSGVRSAQRWKPRYPTSTSTTEPPPSTTTDRAWAWLGQDQDECDHCPGRGCHGVSGGGLLAPAGAAVLQCCSVAADECSQLKESEQRDASSAPLWLLALDPLDRTDGCVIFFRSLNFNLELVMVKHTSYSGCTPVTS